MTLGNQNNKVEVSIGEKSFFVTGVAINSSEVKPGYVFICLEGAKADGHDFASDALKNGAEIIVAQHYIDNIGSERVVIVENTHKAAAEIANQFYDYPSNKMKIVGITGTNGKTTTASIISHILISNGYNCAIIGTTGIYINGCVADDEIFNFDGRTTPDAISFQETLYKLYDAGVDVVVMEVSSHALVQDRIWSTNFDVCAFTNLTQDHLDYHHTMENYFEAKSLLFSDAYPASRVVCIDDKWGQRLDKAIRNNNDIDYIKNKYLTCGFEDKANICSKNWKVSFPLLGKFNRQNLLVAVSVCKLLGLNNTEIIKAVATTPQVDGRMQVINKPDDEKNPKVVIDYAHTPDALEKAASTLKEICKGKLIVVFGCGGDRDKDKRQKMGEVSASIADITILTTDNPRSEDPSKIIDDIVVGFNKFKDADFNIVIDRTNAINESISCADKCDIVLIAGKGHEDYQEINGDRIHFDDREKAREALYLRAKN